MIAASATLKAYQRRAADAHVDEVDDLAEADAVDEVAERRRPGAARGRPSRAARPRPRDATRTSAMPPMIAQR